MKSEEIEVRERYIQYLCCKLHKQVEETVTYKMLTGILAAVALLFVGMLFIHIMR
jgi:hypothetical protein